MSVTYGLVVEGTIGITIQAAWILTLEHIASLGSFTSTSQLMALLVYGCIAPSSNKCRIC